MTKRRGFTVIETILASTLTAMVVGTLISLYALVATRTMHSYTDSNTVWQVSSVADEMSEYISNAINVSTKTVGGTTALKCTMPATGRSANGNGRYEFYEPDKIIGLGQEDFTTGQRVWFYMGDKFGTPSSSGTMIHKAVRSDDLDPSTSTVDWSWERPPGKTTSRFPTITGFVATIDGTNNSVTLTVNGSTEAGTERQAGAQTANTNRYDVTVNRLVLARNYRP